MFRLYRVTDHNHIEWLVVAADPTQAQRVIGRQKYWHQNEHVEVTDIIDATEIELAARAGPSLQVLLDAERAGMAALVIPGPEPKAMTSVTVRNWYAEEPWAWRFEEDLPPLPRA